MYQEHPVGFAPRLGLHSKEISYACKNHFNGNCGKNRAHQSLDRNQSTFFDETSERRVRAAVDAARDVARRADEIDVLGALRKAGA